jgi:phosphoribosylaminoimidazole-succinocarboxamide synthase
METGVLRQSIPDVVNDIEIAWPLERYSGKVRECFWLPDGLRLLAATDRLSAFDMVLASVPFKGQVLNQLSAFWFRELAHIVPNHLVDLPDPNVSLVRECEPLRVEVIVRGFITGVTTTALWTLYDAGERSIYGYEFPDGLRKNDPLPEPIITPTTKASAGEHDERLTCAEVVERGLLDGETWDAVQEAALGLFKRGQETAEAAGFVLVDTKYEFGRTEDGTLMLIDEVHTPDSSRFWKAESVAGGSPEHWDKEYVRLWYVRHGYRGVGACPPLPEEVVVEAARRYIGLYEGLTGRSFEPGTVPAGPRIARVLESFLDR